MAREGLSNSTRAWTSDVACRLVYLTGRRSNESTVELRSVLKKQPTDTNKGVVVAGHDV
jgi:hypothetical protein